MEEIEELLSANRRHREWFSFDDFKLKVYLRITDRYLDGEPKSTIEIATVEVDREYQSQGYFTLFLNEIEKLAEKYERFVYIESIQRGNFLNFLKKRGYKPMTLDRRSLAKEF